jgi:hypothetical protein
MQHRDARVEARAQPAQCLRHQPDFRHQPQRLAALLQHALGQAQVDFGLAAAGDALQQERMKAVARRQHRPQRICLLVVQHRRGAVARSRRAGVKLRALDQVRCGKAARRGPPTRQQGVEFAGGQRRVGQHFQQCSRTAAPAVGIARRRTGCGQSPRFLGKLGGRAAFTQRQRQGTKNDFADGAAPVIRSAAQARKQFRAEQRLLVQHRVDGLEWLPGDDGFRSGFHDDADAAGASEWYAYPRSRARGGRIREVTEGLRQRHRQRNTYDAGQGIRRRCTGHDLPALVVIACRNGR